ncbi:hypothetical protein RUMOBE_00921 [Blautia obeum ATCC 29174]|uniref:Uncharacterized protein n=1 Tax=Blautia obeum ATCC 29174 TaxID=411459 RepID=A5ZPK4_9FIRM|nr:hypothetical protein RUMOBE_00921 [Blautia obeum ATCC 29174]DAS74085.1 MAG TPA: hypothetical protein [Caudoviricetes sp.]
MDMMDGVLEATKVYSICGPELLFNWFVNSTSYMAK